MNEFKMVASDAEFLELLTTYRKKLDYTVMKKMHGIAYNEWSDEANVEQVREIEALRNESMMTLRIIYELEEAIKNDQQEPE